MFKFKLLDDKDIRSIHETAIMMLDTIGMEVAGDVPRQAYLDAGAREKNGRILISERLVEKTLAQVPKNGFEIVGRDASRRFHAVPGEIRFRPAGGLPFTYDYPSGNRRLATLQDAQRIVKLVDALDGIDVANSAVSPADIGAGIGNVHRFVNAIVNSTKPTDITASGPDEIEAVSEIALVIKGSRQALEREPLVVFYVSPTSPMRLSESEALAAIECAKRAMPLAPLSCPTFAATAPVTIAGGVAQEWAEELAMIVLAYSIRPGLPIIACSRIMPVNMRTGNVAQYGATTGMATAVLAEVAASFNLPANGWGFASASHSPDLQAGAERTFSVMMAAMAGTNIISGAGTLDNALVSTAEQLVIDNEIIRIVRNVISGVEVSPKTLAGDYLAEGIGEGTFMASMHTIDNLRSGNVPIADLFSVEPYANWIKKGSADLISRATERVDEILRTHEVEPVDDSKLAEIDIILKKMGAGTYLKG